MSINQVTRKKYKQSKKRNYGQPKTGTSVSKSSQMRKQEKEKRRQERIKNKKPIRRIFPIWLRIIVVLIFSVTALIAGLMIGYGIVGDGVPTDALKFETWQHIIDIVKKE
ncbi:MAG TPA: DNA-directed RNA polymerase subunit beta [Candidatus Dormibacteraeota bacterium]|nr:DNA-directed RNA polymerase subunit beta [Candidatus Dormibacteraeota bacterium]